jgi:hypothetical protein
MLRTRPPEPKARDSMIEVLVIGIILGLLPAAIAKTRGQNFATWWVYGAFLFPIALIHAFVVKPGSRGVERFVTGKAGEPDTPAAPRRPMTREELRQAMNPTSHDRKTGPSKLRLDR